MQTMTTTQLALALFEEFEPMERSITEAPHHLGFRRPNVLVDVSDLSLLGRRALDVAHFIVADDPTIRDMYDVDIGFFTWLMDYSSKNRPHLRRSLREAQKSAVQVLDGPDDEPATARWVSVPLIGVTGISGGRVYFEMDKRIQGLLKSPESSAHFFSLRHVFKHLHAKILYDRLQPYVQEGATPWLGLEQVKEWLECRGKQTYDEYGKFKQKVLNVALEHINEITNLNISFITKPEPGTKRVAELRFRIDIKKDAIDTKSEMLVLKELYLILHDEFGLNRSQFAEILANRDEWTDERIRQAIDYTRFAIQRRQVKLSANGYLMKALRENYRIGTADLLIEQQKATPALPRPGQGTAYSGARPSGFAPAAPKIIVDTFTGETLEEQQERIQRLAQAEASAKAKLEQEVKLGLEAYEMVDDPEDKESLLATFRVSMPAKLAARKLKLDVASLSENIILGEATLRVAFGSFMHQRLSEAARAKVA